MRNDKRVNAMKTSETGSSGNPAVLLAILTICAAYAVLMTQFALPAHASGGRDFAGVYSLTEPTAIGDQVGVTFSARIFNYSDSDIINATVTLKGAGAPKGGFAAFYGISLRDRESVRLRQEITVPAREYQLWKIGHAPFLVIQYQRSSGAAVRGVELRRGFVGEE